MEVRSKRGDIVIIDAGSGIRVLGNKLAKEKVKKFDILFTHAHWDHILGLPFFHLAYQKGVTITIRGCPFNMASYREILRGLMAPPYFPVGMEAFRARMKFVNINQRAFHIGSLRIRPIYISHPNGGLGYRFEEDGRSFVFLTDNELDYVHDMGLGFQDYVDYCKDADLLIHDAEYTSGDYKYYQQFGHSQFEDAVNLAIKAKVKRLGLFHLNRERTDDKVDRMVVGTRSIIAKAKARLDCFAVGNDFEVKL
jgi:phosphoribosyl 1,2-cyclic phosphodiesterase